MHRLEPLYVTVMAASQEGAQDAVADVLEVPVVVCTDGQVCRVLNLLTGRCEPAGGVPVRLGAHRFIAELAWAGVVALSSEEQLREDYTPMSTEPEPGTFTDSAVWSQFGNPERVGLSFDSARRVIAQRLADPLTLTDGDVQLLAAAAHAPVGAGPGCGVRSPSVPPGSIRSCGGGSPCGARQCWRPRRWPCPGSPHG